MSAGKKLLARIDAFLKESNMTPSGFGTQAARDPRLHSDLRKGREPGAATIERVESFMRRWRAQRRAGLVAPRPRREPKPGKAQKLAERALRSARGDPRKAVEQLRVAIESLQPQCARVSA